MSEPAPKPAITPGGPLGRFAVALVLSFVRALPAVVRRNLALRLADVAWLLRVRRRVALDNLAHAFPEKSVEERALIAKGSYRSMALAALDAITSDLLTDEAVQRSVQVTDWKGLDALLDAKQPVLVASAHFGSWELLSEVMARRGVGLSAVVRPLTGAFNEWIVRNRKAAGMELILQRGALVGMVKALARGRVVAQLIDQSLPAGAGVFVPFFGRLASTTPSMAVVARRTGAPVYVALASRLPSGELSLTVEGPVPVPRTGDAKADIREHTAALTAIIERAIRAQPEQWLWLHRRWKVQPPSDGQPQQQAALEEGRVAQRP